MANRRQGSREATPLSNSGSGGVCIMSSRWREEQHPSFVNFITCFLNANAFRLNYVPIEPDFIFNCGGVSVAFIFVTNWNCNNVGPIFDRVQKLKGQFAHFYVVVTLPTKEQNDSFVQSYFRYGMEIGRPTFMPVQDLEMGFEKIVKVAHARGVCKQQDVVSKLKVERERSVQGMDIFLKVVSSIPGVDKHDANTPGCLLNIVLETLGICEYASDDGLTTSTAVPLDTKEKLSQAIGSIEAIAKASKDCILESTDLSAEKAEMITNFFRDPKFYLSPKIS